MRFCVLGSGSRGNATYVEEGETRLLIDAGFSGKELARRLALIDRRPEQLSALLITHEHNDHITGAGILSRRFSLPVYINHATYQAAAQRLGRLYDHRQFATGKVFSVGSLKIHPFSISHDTADPVGFVLAGRRHKLGYCTDTGTITTLMKYQLGRCHGLILEANHDPAMLRNGPYPAQLKQRVHSNLGHLANEDAAAFVRNLASGPLQALILAHVSETNNHPDHIHVAFSDCGFIDDGKARLVLASQDQPSPLIDLNFP